MGLSGRKIKQRIGADPRNLSWADDASRFGSAYLAKFGWNSSQGLGAAGDGRTTHVKVQHKLDMLGIGAAHVNDPNGIAWKQNRDFENLLKRLNEQANGEGEGGEGGEETKVEGFVSEGKGGEGMVDEGRKEKTDKVKKDKKDKVKKVDADEPEGKKRKRKNGKDKEHESKKRKTTEEDQLQEITQEPKVSTPKAQETPAQNVRPVIPRHRAHRARAIAAKKMLSSSATALSEILGIAPTPSSSIAPSGSVTPQGQLTTTGDDPVGEKITTSTKSVADYFKEKLMSKSSGQSGSSTPNGDVDVDDYDAPRGGLGSSRFALGVEGSGPSDTSGLGKFSSLMSSKFLAATSSGPVPRMAENALRSIEKGESIDDADDGRKQKEDKKKKRQKQKDKDNAMDEDRESTSRDRPTVKSSKKKRREEA